MAGGAKLMARVVEEKEEVSSVYEVPSVYTELTFCILSDGPARGQIIDLVAISAPYLFDVSNCLS